MTPAQLLEAAQAVHAQHPDGTLLKNGVGNISVLDSEGRYCGYIDLVNGEVGFW